jgi:hypothetical protein
MDSAIEMKNMGIVPTEFDIFVDPTTLDLQVSSHPFFFFFFFSFSSSFSVFSPVFFLLCFSFVVPSLDLFFFLCSLFSFSSVLLLLLPLFSSLLFASIE